jgi:hypothetical protein
MRGCVSKDLGALASTGRRLAEGLRLKEQKEKSDNKHLDPSRYKSKKHHEDRHASYCNARSGRARGVRVHDNMYGTVRCDCRSAGGCGGRLERVQLSQPSCEYEGVELGG